MGPRGVVRDGERHRWWEKGSAVGGQERERRACKTCLRLMWSRLVSERPMLTAVARWRVRGRSVYPGQGACWVLVDDSG